MKLKNRYRMCRHKAIAVSTIACLLSLFSISIPALAEGEWQFSLNGDATMAEISVDLIPFTFTTYTFVNNSSVHGAMGSLTSEGFKVEFISRGLDRSANLDLSVTPKIVWVTDDVRDLPPKKISLIEFSDALARDSPDAFALATSSFASTSHISIPNFFVTERARGIHYINENNDSRNSSLDITQQHLTAYAHDTWSMADRGYAVAYVKYGIRNGERLQKPTSPHADYISEHQINLTWTAPTGVHSTTESGSDLDVWQPYLIDIQPTTYDIYRYDSHAGTWPTEPIASTSGTTYQDTSITDVKKYAYFVKAVDQNGVEGVPSDTFSAYPPLKITTDTIPDATVGVPYSLSVEATGGDEKYLWTLLADDSMPNGLDDDNVIANSQLSGTPTQAGTYSFSATVDDGSHHMATKQFTLHVNPAPPLQITTLTLPSGLPVFTYQTSLTATGGYGQYHWYVEDNTLPEGLILTEDGGLFGLPTQDGDTEASFTIEVRDDSGQVATQTYSNPIAVPDGYTGDPIYTDLFFPQGWVNLESGYSMGAAPSVSTPNTIKTPRAITGNHRSRAQSAASEGPVIWASCKTLVPGKYVLGLFDDLKAGGGGLIPACGLTLPPTSTGMGSNIPTAWFTHLGTPLIGLNRDPGALVPGEVGLPTNRTVFVTGDAAFKAHFSGLANYVDLDQIWEDKKAIFEAEARQVIALEHPNAGPARLEREFARTGKGKMIRRMWCWVGRETAYNTEGNCPSKVSEVLLENSQFSANGSMVNGVWVPHTFHNGSYIICADKKLMRIPNGLRGLKAALKRQRLVEEPSDVYREAIQAWRQQAIQNGEIPASAANAEMIIVKFTKLGANLVKVGRGTNLIFNVAGVGFALYYSSNKFKTVFQEAGGVVVAAEATAAYARVFKYIPSTTPWTAGAKIVGFFVFGGIGYGIGKNVGAIMYELIVNPVTGSLYDVPLS